MVKFDASGSEEHLKPTPGLYLNPMKRYKLYFTR